MNIYCFSTLSFAKLQFKSVINKAFHKHGVASFTDAWIETTRTSARDYVACVASFTDAWIETSNLGNFPGLPLSHLLQMRGLKLTKISSFFIASGVASFTDAWIETLSKPTLRPQSLVASFTDAWIETLCRHPMRRRLLSHLLQMRGLKPIGRSTRRSAHRRIFYRCVD